MPTRLLTTWLLVTTIAWGLPKSANESQKGYESSIQATVRNKTYYKASSFELGIVVGLMPYDLILDHYNFGARAAWHFSDHYAWEIVDVQGLSSKFTSFTTDLVADSGKAIQRLDALKIKTIIGSNFLLSPLYGKIRFLGSQVVYFDLYATIGLAVANVDTVKLSFSDQTGTVVSSSWDPAFSLGFGVKLFLNHALGLLIDFRDYVVSSTSYDKRSLKSNYTVMAGIAVFLPPL